ncbi:MAG: SDR family NAD(P)-dependent oxidoreductase, partial [Candidatus Zixiibacteriota bacterium]
LAPESGEWKLFAPDDHILAEPIMWELESWGGGGVIICLPPNPDEASVGIMLQAAQAAVENTEPARRLVWVHHGGGATSLAKTIHLETPGLTTCVIDVPYTLESIPWVVDEVKAAEGYTESCYDQHGVRRVPALRLLSLEAEVESPLRLDKNDVLLVTGGGKGIGAECALALAKETGVRLVLVGRARPADDKELSANLKRLTAAGVEFEYVSADVTDETAVKEALEHVQKKFGEITAFLHAAGANVPRLIGDLDRESFLRTLAPQVRGAENVLAALDQEKLRLFVTFGSIIARTGMRGETDYAVANEWLTRLTTKFQAEHPACRCLAVEWSVWSGVGMGERLGRVQQLALEGITAITSDEGSATLEKLLRQKLPSPSVVVSSRFGKPPTLTMEESPLPLRRFLEHQRIFYPGIELICDADLTVNTDPYLEDHVFRGQHLFPAVMGLEAMAQAAMAVVNRASPPVFEDVRFERPVVLPERGKVTIRIAALVRESGSIEVVLRSEETSFSQDHFCAVCRFEDAKDLGNENQAMSSLSGNLIPLEPQTELYGNLLFHKGRFRRLRGYRYLASTACWAEITCDEQSQWFASYLPSELVLGDPALRDTAIHAIQACVPDISLLPVGVERIQIGSTSTSGPWLMHAVERARDGDLYTYDIVVMESDGRVIERWKGLKLQAITGTEHDGDWVAPLLGPYVERRVRGYVPASDVSVAIEVGNSDHRQDRSDQTLRRILGREASVTRRPDGKPEVVGDEHVSISHLDHITMAVVGTKPVGCDIQTCAERAESVWRELLGPARYRLAEEVEHETGEGKAIAATRVWVVSECLTKVGANIDAPIVVLFASGRYKAATTVASVLGCDQPLVLAVLV